MALGHRFQVYAEIAAIDDRHAPAPAPAGRAALAGRERQQLLPKLGVADDVAKVLKAASGLRATVAVLVAGVLLVLAALWTVGRSTDAKPLIEPTPTSGTTPGSSTPKGSEPASGSSSTPESAPPASAVKGTPKVAGAATAPGDGE